MISSAKIKLEDLPRASGVYLMKNAKGEILYIGKAANLRTRVSSYFSKEEQERFQIRFLVSKVDSIETVITANAKEALLLENTLIKKHRPRYNIDLKDDKSYVSLKLSVRDAFPRLYVTRRLKKDGSLYFGPYASAWACREVTDFIEKYFRLRTCSDHEFRNRVRPCLQYQIHRCDAPCVGYINSEEYAKVVRQVKLFLEGKSDELKKIVTGLMQAAAEREAFEEAKNYRDLLCEMERTFEKQQVVSHHNLSRDVIGLYREGEAAAVVVLGVRGGNLQESRHFHFKSHESDGEILASFLLQYYAEEHFIPAEILLPCEVEDRIALEEIFSERAGRKVELHSPQRGAKFDLVKMAAENAKQAFVSRGLKEKNLEDALADLQRRLGLSQVPQTIECYDISNIQGRESVGSMVTFRGGKPDKHGYRHFKIKGVVGADDFASMYELLSRRLKRVSSGASEWALPELILIDGGKGQLNAAAQALKDQGIVGVDLAALAKSKLLAESWRPAAERQGPKPRSEERVFLPKRKNPVFFPPNSSALFVLVQIRDEAHRFGITHHRKLRGKRSLDSRLERIEGIGPIRRKKLLRHFGSVEGLRAATPEAIAEVGGLSLRVAERVKNYLS